MELIGMEGDSYGNSVTPETTGSGHDRGKRPGMEINFYRQQKKRLGFVLTSYFLPFKRNAVFDFSKRITFVYAIKKHHTI